jgi:hypothetical protein
MPDQELQPIFDANTGLVYENYPQTQADLMQMNSAALDRILESMGLAGGGSKVEKQRRLKRFMGLKQL